MPVSHAAGCFNDICDGRASGQQINARVLHTSRHRIAAQPFAAILFNAAQNLGAFTTDPRDPVQGFDVMDQRRLAKNTNLSHKRRPVPWHAALAFDAFNHRGFLTADIRPRTAAQVNIASLNNTRILKCRNLTAQNFEHCRILVTHVNKRLLGLNSPSRDQHPLKEKMRCTLKIIAVFECTGFALITIYSQVTRPCVCAHKTPFFA